MTPFTESMRYEYALHNRSVVLDCGGYQGNFGREIHRLYGCPVWVLEPVRQFRDAMRAGGAGGLIIFPVGIGDETRVVEFGVQGDSTGMFSQSPERERVVVMGIEDLASMFATIDLLKLNIEGMEFEVLEKMIHSDLQCRFRNIQVQFHPVVDNAQQRWGDIRAELLKTHELTFDAPWCWENYRLK